MVGVESELQPCHKQAAFTCAIYRVGRGRSQLRSNYLSSHCKPMPQGIYHAASPGSAGSTARLDTHMGTLWSP